MKIVEPVASRREVLLRLSADQDGCAANRVLANFVAELFTILHPATLPMLERIFEDAKQDTEKDGELELRWR